MTKNFKLMSHFVRNHHFSIRRFPNMVIAWKMETICTFFIISEKFLLKNIHMSSINHIAKFHLILSTINNSILVFHTPPKVLWYHNCSICTYPGTNRQFSIAFNAFSTLIFSKTAWDIFFKFFVSFFYLGLVKSPDFWNHLAHWISIWIFPDMNYFTCSDGNIYIKIIMGNVYKDESIYK